MPSKEAKKRKDYRAANKEKLNAYSKYYSKEHGRKKYYEEYYACDRDLSQKKSAATSRFTYHENPEKAEHTLLLSPKQTITKILKKVKADSTANPKLRSYDKHIEES